MSANANANSIEPRSINVPLVVVGAIVVIAAFVATVLVGQFSGRSSLIPTATQGVLVAPPDVSPRTVLVPAHLTVAHYAVTDVPPNSMATTASAVGLVAQTSLKKGQP